MPCSTLAVVEGTVVVDAVVGASVVVGAAVGTVAVN